MTTENKQAFEELRQLLVSAEGARSAAERVLLAFPNAEHEASILLGRAWALYEEFYKKRTGQNLTSSYSNFTNLSSLKDITTEELSKEMQSLTGYKISETGKCPMTLGHLEDICIFLDGEFKNALKSLKNEYNINFRSWKYRNHVIIAGACILALILILCLYHAYGPKPWRVSYYANTGLSGRPVFSEEVGKPTEGSLARAKAYLQRKSTLRGEGFSAKYEGCLKLDSEKDVIWSLGSDDGSRLFVDNQQIIDNWGIHSFMIKKESQHLTKGTHTIRVEFFDQGGTASLDLRTTGDNNKLVKSINALPENGRCE